MDSARASFGLPSTAPAAAGPPITGRAAGVNSAATFPGGARLAGGIPAGPLSLAGRPGPIPGDPSAGDRVLPADTWPVRWGHHDGLELGALASAVPCARARMREILREWGLAALVPDAEVIIAELAANAITATRGGVERDGGQGFVRRWMLEDLSRLLILVWDPAPGPPVVGEPGDEDEHGRGLLLVEALAARWRWYHPARPYGGKVVWALLEATRWPGAGRADAVMPGGMAPCRTTTGGTAAAGGATTGGAAPGEGGAGVGPRRLEAAGR